MISSKLVVSAVTLTTMITLGGAGTASAVGTRAIDQKTLDAITAAFVPNWKEAHTQPKGEPKEPVKEQPAVTPPAPAPIQEAPAPEPAPVVEPAPPITEVSNPSPTGTPDCELARSLINQYSWNTEVAYNVMVQESGCNPMAANWNDHHGSCVGSFGLFQMNCTLGQLYDPAANVAAAFNMWQQSGWSGWSFTTCKIVSCY